MVSRRPSACTCEPYADRRSSLFIPMYAADRACINTLEQALDVCDLLGEGVGVAIDAYHVWWDPKLHAQIARAGAGGRILAHHICDWLVPTRDLLLDRGMMGDGVIDLRSIRAAIEKAGYDGPQEFGDTFPRKTGGSAWAKKSSPLVSNAISPRVRHNRTLYEGVRALCHSNRRTPPPANFLAHIRSILQAKSDAQSSERLGWLEALVENSSL